MQIEETEWMSWVRMTTGAVEEEGLMLVKAHHLPGMVRVFHPKHDKATPVDGTITGNRLSFTIAHKDTKKTREYSGPIAVTPVSARIDGGFVDERERGGWIATIKYKWDSFVTPDNTAEPRDDEGIMETIEQLVPGTVKVFHPRHNTSNPVNGTITANTIEFIIHHNMKMHRRRYNARVEYTSDGAETRDGRYNGPVFLAHEQISENEQNSDGESLNGSDDGGWEATRPPT